jgi:hypothetical protein
MSAHRKDRAKTDNRPASISYFESPTTTACRGGGGRGGGTRAAINIREAWKTQSCLLITVEFHDRNEQRTVFIRTSHESSSVSTPSGLGLAFSAWTEFTVRTVRGNGHPRGMSLVTRMAALQAEQRRETQWHSRVCKPLSKNAHRAIASSRPSTSCRSKYCVKSHASNVVSAFVLLLRVKMPCSGVAPVRF